MALHARWLQRSGVARSQPAARHVAASYPEILRCLDEGAPPPFADGPAEGTQRLAREPIALARCTSVGIGPFHVATGGRLRARLDGDAAGARVRVIAGTSIDAGEERCAGDAEGCEAEGPGPFVVEVMSLT